MKYYTLHGCPLQASSHCFGCMHLTTTDDDSLMLDCARDLGINFFDTADVYGNENLSEKALGTWSHLRHNRSNILISTKCGIALKGLASPDRSSIIESAHNSLKRLQTDYIDLYFIHIEHNRLPEEEILEAFDLLIRQGKILSYGASNYSARRLEKSTTLAKSRLPQQHSCFQAHYNLLERSIEREHIQLLLEKNIPLACWSPLAKGLLADRKVPPSPSDSSSPRYRYQVSYNTPKHQLLIETLSSLSKQLQIPVSTLSISWLLQHPAVRWIVFGASSLQQLKENTNAANYTLPPEAFNDLSNASMPDLGYPYDGIARFNTDR